jgi:hypothetical protein
MRRIATGWIIILAAITGVACAGPDDATQETITEIESELARIRDVATEYAPDKLRVVDSKMASLQEKFVSGDYAAANADAREVLMLIDNLKQVIFYRQAHPDSPRERDQ